MVFFFFKQKTAYEMRISDWSSDVCSSDLVLEIGADRDEDGIGRGVDRADVIDRADFRMGFDDAPDRIDQCRVGRLADQQLLCLAREQYRDRGQDLADRDRRDSIDAGIAGGVAQPDPGSGDDETGERGAVFERSEEHTSELQSL